MRSSPDRRSAVIKAPQVLAAQRPSPAARAQAAAAGPQRLLLIAAQQAAALLAAAERDARQIRQDALDGGRTDGYRAGHAEGLQLGRAEAIAAAEAEARRIVGEAEEEARRVLSGAEERVGLLACEIAAHLIGTELRQSPETIERAVAQTLQGMGGEGDLAVEVAPGDYEQAVQAIGTWREGIGGHAEIRVVVDPALPRGGYRVLGPSGAVERNWRDGLAAIAQAFEEVARRGV